MVHRLKLHEKLCELLKSRNVYFQPPESIKMTYPCIKYSISGMDHKRANDMIYKNANRYEIIVIDYEPDSEIPDLILSLFPMCRFDRVYAADKLYHYVLTLHY